MVYKCVRFTLWQLINKYNNMRKFTHKPLIEIIALGVATLFGFMIIGGLTTVIIEVALFSQVLLSWKL